jgi:hypothetical protein
MKSIPLLRFRYPINLSLYLAIFLIYAWMARLPDLRLSVPEWIGGSAGIMILLTVNVFFSRLHPDDPAKNPPHSIGGSIGFIILVAAILRMMFLWRTPELSDDIYRYLFDGMTLLSGHNPFAAAPGDVMPTDPVMVGLILNINHADLPTIYPPAAQFVFAAGAFIGGIFGMKLILVFLDVLTCILIIKLLVALKRPAACAVLYAWHPLPVIEVAASGHVDAAALFFTFSAIFLLLTKKIPDGNQCHRPNQPSKAASLFPGQGVYGFAAGIFFVGAVLAKWVPLIWMPGMLLLASPEKRRFFVYGFLFSLMGLCWVFQPDIVNCFYTLSVYAANWEFSGFAFRWLRAATGSGAIARYILAAAFMITIAMIYNRDHRQTAAALKIPLNPPLSKGDFKFPFFQCHIHKDIIEPDRVIDIAPPLPMRERSGVRELIFKVIKLFTPTHGSRFPRTSIRGPAQALSHRWGGEKRGWPSAYGHLDILKGLYFTFMAFLLLSPTLHPWYGLYLAAFLPFAAGPAGIVFSWSIFLAYRVVILYALTGEWIENDIIAFLMVAGPAAAFAASCFTNIFHRRYLSGALSSRHSGQRYGTTASSQSLHRE